MADQLDVAAYFPRAALQDKIMYALQAANKYQIDSVEMSLSYEIGYDVTARFGAVETIEHQQEKSFLLTLYKNNCRRCC